MATQLVYKWDLNYRIGLYFESGIVYKCQHLILIKCRPMYHCNTIILVFAIKYQNEKKLHEKTQV